MKLKLHVQLQRGLLTLYTSELQLTTTYCNISFAGVKNTLQIIRNIAEGRKRALYNKLSLLRN